MLNGEQSPDARFRLAQAFAGLLADIHRTDWRALGIDWIVTDPVGGWDEQASSIPRPTQHPLKTLE